MHNRLLQPLAAGLILGAFGLLLLSAESNAQSSTTSISFQGVLNGTGNAPLANNRYDLTFRFHTNATLGTAIATSTVPQVAVTNGVASAAIPVQTAWFDGSTRWLGITVAGQNGGQELAPRVLVTAVPYAAHALAAAGLAIEDGSIPAGALRGPDRTWLFGYKGVPGAEDISIGSPDGVGSERTLTLAAGGLPRIHIAENGFVGMGSLRPDSLLHLNGLDVELRLTSGGGSS